MTTQERTQLTAQLVRGKDDDLIQWLNSLPAGSRQKAIKGLLREALGYPDPDEDTRPFQPVSLVDLQADRIAELERILKELLAWRDDHENWIEQRLAGYTSQPVSTGEGLSDHKQAKRLKNLKKATW